MIKINFKQPKYIFPLVVFVPLCALVYFVMQTFGEDGETEQTVATDRINMELPQPMPKKPATNSMKCHAASMTRMPLPQSVALAKRKRKRVIWNTVTAKKN